MQKPHTEQTLEVFAKHPEGITMDQLRTKLKRKSNKDVQNTLQLLKKKGCPITKAGKVYTISNKSTSVSSGTDGLIELLRNNPNGISRNDLANFYKISLTAASNKIFFARQKGVDIQNIGGKYHYKGESIPATPKVVNQSAPIVSKLMSAKHREAFTHLSDIDKADCVDMLKKSLYYYKSATALIESNSEVLSFLSSIGGDL